LCGSGGGKDEDKKETPADVEQTEEGKRNNLAGFTMRGEGESQKEKR